MVRDSHEAVEGHIEHRLAFDVHHVGTECFQPLVRPRAPAQSLLLLLKQTQEYMKYYMQIPRVYVCLYVRECVGDCIMLQCFSSRSMLLVLTSEYFVVVLLCKVSVARRLRTRIIPQTGVRNSVSIVLFQTSFSSCHNDNGITSAFCVNDGEWNYRSGQTQCIQMGNTDG